MDERIAVWSWAYQLSPHFVQEIWRKRRQATDKWLLDEVFVTINEHRYYLWRAVDSNGIVLDILMQTQSQCQSPVCHCD